MTEHIPPIDEVRLDMEDLVNRALWLANGALPMDDPNALDVHDLIELQEVVHAAVRMLWERCADGSLPTENDWRGTMGLIERLNAEVDEAAAVLAVRPEFLRGLMLMQCPHPRQEIGEAQAWMRWVATQQVVEATKQGYFDGVPREI